MIGCHAQRLKDGYRADEMERKSEPLVWMFIFILAVIFADYVLDVHAARKHEGDIATAKMFAECLNGKPVQYDDKKYASCIWHQTTLVNGLK